MIRDPGRSNLRLLCSSLGASIFSWLARILSNLPWLARIFSWLLTTWIAGICDTP